MRDCCLCWKEISTLAKCLIIGIPSVAVLVIVLTCGLYFGLADTDQQSQKTQQTMEDHLEILPVKTECPAKFGNSTWISGNYTESVSFVSDITTDADDNFMITISGYSEDRFVASEVLVETENKPCCNVAVFYSQQDTGFDAFLYLRTGNGSNNTFTSSSQQAVASITIVASNASICNITYWSVTGCFACVDCHSANDKHTKKKRSFDVPISTPYLTYILRQDVVSGTKMRRKLLGELPELGILSHTGIKVVLRDGKRFIIHKTRDHGTTTIVPEHNWHYTWHEDGPTCYTIQNYRVTVWDMVRVSGDGYNEVTNNCHQAVNRVLKAFWKVCTTKPG